MQSPGGCKLEVMSTTLTPDAKASGVFTIGGDLTVHRLGFGAMRITGAGVWGDPKDPKEARAVLRRVVELGINFIDTADSYGRKPASCSSPRCCILIPRG